MVGNESAISPTHNPKRVKQAGVGRFTYSYIPSTAARTLTQNHAQSQEEAIKEDSSSGLIVYCPLKLLGEANCAKCVYANRCAVG